MIGLAVLAGIAIYIAVWWLLVSSLKRTWGKAAAIVVALAIPFWDLPIGYSNFYVHCRDDAGTRVPKAVSSLNTILIDSSSGYTPDELLRYGFSTVEYESREGIVRYTHTRGAWNKTLQPKPLSAVRLRFGGNQALPWNLIRSSYVVTSIAGNDVIASQTSYHWLGVWWQAKAGGLFGGGPECGPTEPLLQALSRGR